MKLEEQRKIKIGRIVSEGFHGFYYVSHAPFLFAVPNTDALSQIQTILKNAGIPEKRFEKFKQQAELNMLFHRIAKTHEGLIHEDQIYIKSIPIPAVYSKMK